MHDYILVTGGAGFIGSHVCSRLVKAGYRVVVVDNLSTGLRENIIENVEFLYGDVSDPIFVRTLSKYKFSRIYHIAGQSGGESSYDNPVYDLRSNVQSTLLLLELCREIGCNEFIFTSSFSVYGNVPFGCKAQEITETKPNSFYAISKLVSENYLKLYSEQFGINSLVLRLPSIYGPGQNLGFLKQGIVSIYLAQALTKKNILVRGSADRFRDLLHVDDVVDFLESLLDSHPRGFELVNICSSMPVKVKNIIKIIQDNLPYKLSVEYTGGTPGDVFGVLGDNSKAVEVYRWSPRIGLDDGVNAMVQWAIKKVPNS